MVEAAALYVRISHDPDEERAGVARQLVDCRKRALSLGWPVGEVFEDNDVSAYRRGVLRPAWTAMLEALRSGKCDALVAYDLDRVARKPRDLEDLIDIMEERGLPNAVCTGDIDLSSPTGQTTARLMVTMAHKSSADTARRVSRARQQKAENGIPSRSRFRPYGYDREWQPIDKEVQIVQEIFERVAAGEGLAPIALDLNRRGVPTTEGKTWRWGTIGTLVRNPIRLGKVTLKGVVVSTGTHPALLDEALFDSANAALRAKSKPPGHNARRWLLAGFLTCTRCGHSMTISSGHRGNKKYACRKEAGGCNGLTISAADVNKFVEVTLLAYLDRTTFEPEQPADLDGPLARAEAEVAAVQSAYDSGDLALPDYLPTMKTARTHLAEIRVLRAESDQARRAHEVEADPRGRWERGTLSQRRAMIGTVIDSIAVLKAKPNGGRFDPARISIGWKP